MKMMTGEMVTAELWLRDWLAARAPGLELGPDDNYFEKAAIDSFDAITLIEEAEQAFAIRFQQADFQERRFATLRGFGQIVAERQKTA
jgi:acyl carrier protein